MAFETKKKIAEKLAKIEKVVQNATEKAEWGKLYELVKSGGQPAPEPAAAEASDASADK